MKKEKVTHLNKNYEQFCKRFILRRCIMDELSKDASNNMPEI